MTVKPGDTVTVPPDPQHLTVERIITIVGNSENVGTVEHAVLTYRTTSGTLVRFTALLSNLQPVEVPT